MKVAVPTAGGVVCGHFGRCEAFAVFEVDTEQRRILHHNTVSAPAHQPGLLPKWLADLGVEVVIAGGMGPRAVNLLSELGITALVGAGGGAPEQVVQDWLSGDLQLEENLCDH